jgi:Fic family protein
LARDLFARVSADRSRVLEESTASVAALRLFEMLPANPIVTVNSAIRLLETTKPTAGKAVDTLVTAGVLHETTGRQRGREFAYQAYLAKLGADAAG